MTVQCLKCILNSSTSTWTFIITGQKNKLFNLHIDEVLVMEATFTPVAAAAAGIVCKFNEKRMGRGVPEVTEAYNKICSCRREKTIVFCRACGYYCHGRIRLICEKHPRVTFLLDISECPRCHSSAFLDECFAK